MPFKAAKTLFKLERLGRKLKRAKRKDAASEEALAPNASLRSPQKRSELGAEKQASLAAEERTIGDGEEREREMAECIVEEGLWRSERGKVGFNGGFRASGGPLMSGGVFYE